MEIEEIVVKAIPAETCPIKNEGAMDRREKLKQRILNLLAKRDKTKPYSPALEFKDEKLFKVEKPKFPEDRIEKYGST